MVSKSVWHFYGVTALCAPLLDGRQPAHHCPALRLSRTRSGKCLETLRPVTGAKPQVIHLGMSITDWCGVCLASTFRNLASTFRNLASTFRFRSKSPYVQALLAAGLLAVYNGSMDW